MADLWRSLTSIPLETWFWVLVLVVLAGMAMQSLQGIVRLLLPVALFLAMVYILAHGSLGGIVRAVTAWLK